MSIQKWQQHIRDSYIAFHEAEEAKELGDNRLYRELKRVEREHELNAEASLRIHYKMQLILEGEQIGLSEQDIDDYLQLESEALEIETKIAKGERYLLIAKDDKTKSRYKIRLDDLYHDLNENHIASNLLTGLKPHDISV